MKEEEGSTVMLREGSMVEEGWESIIMSKVTMRGLGSTM